MKRILCLYTGGTIGCLPTAQGLAPAAGSLTSPLTELATGLPESPQIELVEYAELLDSSSMGPADWNRIGADIVKYHDDFDGFVILHGTDTLAYTAAALSYQLEHLAKPVLITGSQRPWHTEGSDAPANVAAALNNAIVGKPGVRVAFGERLLPGTRVRKSDADRNQAFTAPNWDGHWPDTPTTNSPASLIEVDPAARIIGLKLYPGFSYDWLRAALATPMQAIVIESYGSGNLPAHPGLLDALQNQAKAGAVLVNCTQCHAGNVQQGHYAASSILNQIGALPAADMTPEAALTKLYMLFAKQESRREICNLFRKNLRGELSADLC